MANIESLHGSDKLREAYPKVNRNFNAVDREVTDLRTRVNNIITTPIDGEAAAQEVVDARNSAAKSKIFDTLDARLEEIEQDNASVAQELAAHKEDIVQTTEVNSSTKYPSAAVTHALQQAVNARALKNAGLTMTSAVVNASYYNITLIMAGLAADLGMFIASRGNVVSIKNSTKASVSQAADGKITITSTDGVSNISYLVIQ